MSSVRIYATAADAMEQQPFVCMAPIHAAPQSIHVIDELEEYGGRPAFQGAIVYTPEDELYQIALTTERMIDLFAARVEFHFTEEIDIIHCMNIMDDYVAEAASVQAVSQEVRNYLAWMKPFHDRLTNDMVPALLRKHPSWAKQYDQQRPRIVRLMEALVPPSFLAEFKKNQKDSQRYRPIGGVFGHNINSAPQSTVTTATIPGMDAVDLSKYV